MDTDQPVSLRLISDVAMATSPCASNLQVVGVVGSDFYTEDASNDDVPRAQRWTVGQAILLEGIGHHGDGRLIAVSDLGFAVDDSAFDQVALHRFEAPGTYGAPTASIDDDLLPMMAVPGLVGHGADERLLFVAPDDGSGWETASAGALTEPVVRIEGASTAWFPDATGDGAPDMIVQWADDPSTLSVFAAPLPSGALSRDLAVAAVEIGGSAIIALTGGGDVTGDGIFDLLLSRTPGAQSGREVFVLAGPVVGALTLEEVTLRITGVGADDWGSAVAPVGDIDGDGRSDIVFGAPGPRSGEDIPGRVCVYRTGDWPGVSSVSASELPCRWGQVPGERAGMSLAVLDDLDGDGLHDVAAISGGRPASGTPEDDAPPERPAIPAWVYWLSGADLATWEAP